MYVLNYIKVTLLLMAENHHILYNEKLATYTKEDAFNQESAVGFIDIFGLPTKVNSMLHGGYKDEQ